MGVATLSGIVTVARFAFELLGITACLAFFAKTYIKAATCSFVAPYRRWLEGWPMWGVSAGFHGGFHTHQSTAKQLLDNKRAAASIIRSLYPRLLSGRCNRLDHLVRELETAVNGMWNKEAMERATTIAERFEKECHRVVKSLWLVRAVNWHLEWYSKKA